MPIVEIQLKLSGMQILRSRSSYTCSKGHVVRSSKGDVTQAVKVMLHRTICDDDF